MKKRQHILTFLLASLLFVFAFHGGHVNAQGSISGDDVCGTLNHKCGLSDFKTITQRAFRVVLSLGLPALVAFIIYRFVMAWFALEEGNANAYKEATKRVTQAIVGFLMIVALFGGLFLAMLRYAGVNESFLNLLKDTSFFELIPHAYAADQQLLPNTTGFTSLYDFFIGAINLIMKFFMYPAMITVWVWSGFMYVAAQGAPEKLAKAHKLLLMAFVTTLITFTTHGFLLSLKASVDKILPAPTATVSPAGTADGRTVPADGAVGSPCTLDDGVTTGIYGGDPANPTCYPSGRGR